MGNNKYFGDVSEETTSEGGSILFWMAALILGALLVIFVIRFMFRINYKLTQIREQFRPTIGRILIILLIIGILFGLFVFILNVVSRRKYKDSEEIDKE